MFRLMLPLLLCFAICLCAGCTLVPQRVAVMDFENASDNVKLDKFNRSVAENFTNVMANYPGIVILDRQDIQAYLSEIDREGFKSRKITRFQELGRRLDIDFLVIGSVAKYDDVYLVLCRLFNVEKGEIIPGTARQNECRSERDIIAVCQRLGSEMVKEVHRHSSWLPRR